MTATIVTNSGAQNRWLPVRPQELEDYHSTDALVLAVLEFEQLHHGDLSFWQVVTFDPESKR